MTSKAFAAGVLLACLLIFPVKPATALYQASNGKVLAQKWCSSCHLVSADQDKASADAPPFATIAKRPEEELERLQTFLIDPHPVMPNFNLSRDEITDVVAYIRSLKP